MAPLPRRTRISRPDRDLMRPQLRRVSYPKAPFTHVFVRTVRWLFALAYLALRIGLDRLRGKAALTRTAVYVREMFESMGGIAIKLGQQLAARADLIPFEICLELGELLDAVPPFDAKYALRRIESVIGKPATEVFKHFDDVPIGSASIACVFRAVLHTGEEVAVKVRRPDVGRAFMGDLAVIDVITQFLELATLVRPGFFKYFRTEMREMFLDELDFRKEATFQILFRKHAAKDRVDWLSAPRVYPELSGDDVLTTEFIRGDVCTKLLEAVETKDEATLAYFAAKRVDPKVIAERLMLISFWSRHERPFFHADPHPGNIVLQPDNRIQLLDFGACGVMSRKNVQSSVEVQRRIVEHDIAGCSVVSAGLLAPLPFIDTSELIYRLENKYFRFYMGAWTKDAEWWERTTAKLWLNLIEVTREFGLPVNLDMLRLMRSSLLYDTLACRLDPGIRTPSAFRKWSREAAKRTMRRRRKQRERMTPERTKRLVQGLVGDSAELLAKGAFWLSNFSRDPPLPRIPMIGKAAFFATTMLDFFTNVFWIMSAVGLVLAVQVWTAGGPSPLIGDPMVFAARSLAHPIFGIAVLVSFVISVRRILFRLGDKDASGS